MLGTIVNAVAIIAGSLLGLLFSKGIKKKLVLIYEVEYISQEEYHRREDLYARIHNVYNDFFCHANIDIYVVYYCVEETLRNIFTMTYFSIAIATITCHHHL